jgi:hypothetical protein
MSFSAFSLFFQKFVFLHFKSQLKSLPFVSAFDFSTFQLKKVSGEAITNRPSSTAS